MYHRRNVCVVVVHAVSWGGVSVSRVKSVESALNRPRKVVSLLLNRLILPRKVVLLLPELRGYGLRKLVDVDMVHASIGEWMSSPFSPGGTRMKADEESVVRQSQNAPANSVERTPASAPSASDSAETTFDAVLGAGRSPPVGRRLLIFQCGKASWATAMQATKEFVGLNNTGLGKIDLVEVESVSEMATMLFKQQGLKRYVERCDH